jgi:hypothetical protein
LLRLCLSSSFCPTPHLPAPRPPTSV